MGGKRAETVHLVRDWSTFAVANGQVVYRGRYYFTWSGGSFIGAYNTLDDAVESLNLLQDKFQTNLGPTVRGELEQVALSVGGQPELSTPGI